MKPQLIFDGDCAFCTTTADWIAARLGDAASVEPWQHLDLDAVGLSEHDVTTAAWWIDAWGHPHRGADAIARSLIASGRPWSIVDWPMRIPPVSWVAAGVYALVARYRHRLPGGTPACRLDPPPG